MKIFISLLAIFFLTGCADIHHVSPEKFESELNNIASFYWCEYIGQADGKAYLLRKTPSFWGDKWKEEILFTELDGLDKIFFKNQKEIKDRKSTDKGFEFMDLLVPKNQP